MNNHLYSLVMVNVRRKIVQRECPVSAVRGEGVVVGEYVQGKCPHPGH